MSRYGRFLPVIIGGGKFKKGLLVGKRDLWIVWLKHEYASGEHFSRDDVEKIDTILHFCDRPSVENMINALKIMLEHWEGK